MLGEMFDFVVGLEEPGFIGRGGGALSGSELSHLRFKDFKVSLNSPMNATGSQLTPYLIFGRTWAPIGV